MSTIQEIILKSLREPLSPSEKMDLDQWLAEDPQHQLLLDELNDRERVGEALDILGQLSPEKAWAEVAGESQVAKVRVISRRWISYAAAVLILVAGGTGYWLSQRKVEPVAVARFQSDAKPGQTRAMIILADGTKVPVDPAGNGLLAQDGGVRLINENGSISYQGKSTDVTAFNTYVTGRAEQSPPITLADGTKVWLDAESSIRFPLAFNGATREVEITGQPYFEVAHNRQKPFVVKHGKQQVMVLGTHFNVNAYSDETAMRVTLLEGSVRVINGNNAMLIRPGQQAILNNAKEDISLVPDADVEQVMAWRTGKFMFNEVTSIGTVMNEIGRWYNMRVEYKDGIEKSGHIWGSVSRSSSVVQVLEKLELTGEVEFRTEGDKIIVFPKGKANQPN